MMDSFELTVEKYLAGDMSEQEQESFLESVEQSTERKEYLRRCLLEQAMLADVCREDLSISKSSGELRMLSADRVPRRPRGWYGWLAAAACLASALGVWHLQLERRMPVAHVLAAEGCTVIRNGEEYDLSAGEELYLDDRLKGQGRFKYHEEATTIELLPPGADAKLTELNGAKEIRLGGGKLTASVAKQEKQMKVMTPHATVTVIGTKFTVETKREDTRVAVEKGRVSVSKKGTSHTSMLTAGESILWGRGNERVFQENGGTVAMEAEHYTRRSSGVPVHVYSPDPSRPIPPESVTLDWEPSTSFAGHSGRAAMSVKGRKTNCRGTDRGPRLEYAIRFTTPGTYYVWLRVHCPDSASNSIHAGLNGRLLSNRYPEGIRVFSNATKWQWASYRPHLGEPFAVTIKDAGVHTFVIWMRENLVSLDKIILTKDVGFNPVGLGPGESAGVTDP